MIEKHQRWSTDNNEKQMLQQACGKAFRVWLTVEENHPQEIREKIADVAEGRLWITLNRWEDYLDIEHGKILFRGRNLGDDLAAKLSRIKLPSLVLKLSNAPTHEIRQRLKNVGSLVDKGKRESEIGRIREIVADYIMAIRMLDGNAVARPEKVDDDSLEDCIQRAVLHEVRVESRMEEIRERVEAEVTQVVERLLSANDGIGENNDAEDSDFTRLVDSLRVKAANAKKESREDLETAYDLGLRLRARERPEETQPRKNGPGRPKKEKKHDDNQMKIDSFLIR